MVLRVGGPIVAGLLVAIGTTYASEIASYIETTVDSASLALRQSPDALARYIHDVPGLLVRAEIAGLRNGWEFAFGGEEQRTAWNFCSGNLATGTLVAVGAAAAWLKKKFSTPEER